MFDIDYNKVVVWLLPRKVRTVFNASYLKALVSPIVELYNKFKSYRADVQYKLNHNGQVCYLEGALNDSFDIVERRIYISDAGGAVVSLLHRDSDEEPLLLRDDANGAFVIHNDSAYEGGSFDFIVNIPYRFSDADMFRLKALVDYYKLAGKRYDVVVK